MTTPHTTAQLAAQPVQAPSPANNWVGQRATARKNSFLHGPVYVPAPSPAMRAGALNYQRIASLGVRC